jgi:protein SCO1/2
MRGKYRLVKVRALIQIKISPDFSGRAHPLISIGPVRKLLAIETAAALGLALAFPACHRATETETTGGAQHYETRGIIRGFSPDRKTIEIEHENIPGFMPSMTMPFAAQNQKEIVDLETGDAISFRITVTETDFWIDRVKQIPRNEMHIAEPTATIMMSPNHSARLREGDVMPFFTLTNQKGERVTLDTFRDQPFVLTFVFTRCPMPNFCPRMSNHFSELQRAIKADTGALAQTHLLSITLDPEFDTPEILRQYGQSHSADLKIWNFATGEAKEIDALTHAFSVYRETEGGTISHGLATALIDKNGKIDKIWRGNGWTPAEVIQEINRHGN